MSECAWSQGRPAAGGSATLRAFRLCKLQVAPCLGEFVFEKMAREREAWSSESRTITCIGVLKLQSSDTAVLKRDMQYTAA